MWLPSPRSVVALSYRGMIQYLVIAVVGEFPSSGKENGYQGLLSHSGLLDLFLKLSKFPVPSITAARMFPNLQLIEIALILQPPVFLASEFHCPCPGLCAWQIWCISHFLSEESAERLTATAPSTAKWSFLSFTNTCSHFCSWSYQAEWWPRTRLLTPQSPLERCSSWLTSETETLWL